ncbi:MAG: protein kinase domain-containing protein [Blastocatellia bacterium]
MKPERWRQIDELLQSALEREASERPVFLDEACAGDRELRREVESFIAAHERTGDFLEAPALDAAAKAMANDHADRETRITTSHAPTHGAATLLGADQIEADRLAPGVTLDGRYLIERELDRGGLGAVFLAHDQKLHGAPVVVKVLLEKLHESQQRAWFEKKFRQEIKALARIDHPGVVRALDVGELPDGRSYLVMQYIHGVPLRSVIPPHGMELDRAGRLIHQIAQALTAAHEQGVVHRDLKPENILLQTAGDEEYVKLIDFGIATVRETLEPATAEMTKVAGTTGYMAPEQLMGKPAVASDVYALGVIAYELVTGRRPFNPDTFYQLLDLQRTGVRVMPCDLRSSLPAAAQAAILKALSFAAPHRYVRARDFSEAFNQALALDSEQKPAGTNGSLRPRPARARLLLLLAALLVVAAAGALIWRSTRSGDGGQDVRPPASVIAPERRLIYSLTVMKDPKRYPNSQPFQLPGATIIFEAGYQVRMNVSSPQAGYLYVINEGPKQTNGRPDFNVLFPDTLANGGSAAIAANQTIRIPQPSGKPEQDWFTLDDKEEGVEKIWLVWSERSVPELEAVKRWANPKDGGAIGDPGQIESVARYLAAHSAPAPEVKEDEEQTTLKSRGEVLVGLVKVQHR